MMRSCWSKGSPMWVAGVCKKLASPSADYKTSSPDSCQEIHENFVRNNFNSSK